MKVFKHLVVVLFFLLISIITLHSQIAIIYGTKHLYSILTPDHWILDRNLAKQIGLPHLIYPDSETNIKQKRNFIYSRGVDRPDGSDVSIDDFIIGDIKHFKKDIPEIKITKLDTVFTNIVKNNFLSGKYYFYKFIYPNGRYENVLYIDATETIVTIIYSTDSKKSHDKYYNDFLYLIDSFTFLGRKGTA